MQELFGARSLLKEVNVVMWSLIRLDGLFGVISLQIISMRVTGSRENTLVGS